MKRVLSIIGIIVAVLITGAVVFGVLLYTGVIKSEDIDNLSVYVYENGQGQKYTVAEWSWKPIEDKKIISYVNVPATVPTVTVALAFDNDTYYDIKIPDVPYVYDFGKTVWAEDGSFMIRVVGNATMDNLAALAGIDNGESINQYTIKSPDGQKGARTIATLIKGTGIIVNIYSGNQTYSILRDSIADNRFTYSFSEVPYANGCKYIDKVSYTGSFIPSVSVDDKSIKQNRHMFEEGMLWTQTVVQVYADACHTYLAKMVASSVSGKVELYYDDGVKMYAKSGDYYVGVVKLNANTCIALIGMGEEANCNIVSIMSNY